MPLRRTAKGCVGGHEQWNGRRGMNRFERLFGLRGEARLRYFDGEFQVLIPGDFVRCAVSGEPIAIADLRYWSVELQEAYATAEIAFERHRVLRNGGRRGRK
jgi:hypothetical protein